MPRSVDQSREGGHNAPGDHNSGRPFPRAPELYEQCSWNFQKNIAEKEDARAETEYLVGEAELTSHVEAGEPYIDAIEKGNDIKNEKERQEPAIDTLSSTFFEGGAA